MKAKNKCPNCGFNEWYIAEYTLWIGSLNADGEMNVEKNRDPTVGTIECCECGYIRPAIEEIILHWPKTQLKHQQRKGFK